MSMIASPSAIRPATWAVSTGAWDETASALASGSEFCLPGCAGSAGLALGTAEGLIAGNNVAALPAPMSRLASAFRFGTGPSGSGGRVALAEDAFDEWVDGWGVAAAEVTEVVPDAAGGVHLTVLTMLAVAVSFTDVTDVALDATGICA